MDEERPIGMEGNPLLAIAIAVLVILSLIAVTIIALQLISAGRDIADGIITAATAPGGPTTPDQPDVLTNGWLVVATAFVAGVAPLIALGAAVGKAFAGGNPGSFRNTIRGGGDSEGEGNQGRASSRSRVSIFASEPAVSATAVAAIVQLFVLLNGTLDVSPETQAAIVAGLTALAGLYIRQKEPTP
jgi:hypothetical protein